MNQFARILDREEARQSLELLTVQRAAQVDVEPYQQFAEHLERRMEGAATGPTGQPQTPQTIEELKAAAGF